MTPHQSEHVTLENEEERIQRDLEICQRQLADVQQKRMATINSMIGAGVQTAESGDVKRTQETFKVRDPKTMSETVLILLEKHGMKPDYVTAVTTLMKKLTDPDRALLAALLSIMWHNGAAAGVNLASFQSQPRV